MGRLSVSRIPERPLRSDRVELVDESLRYAFLHINSAVGHAGLSAVPHDAVLRLLGSFIDVRVGEHHGGRLAAHFEDEMLEVGVRSSFLDEPPRAHRPGEGQGADLHVARNSSAGYGTMPVDDIDDAGRKPRLFDHRAQAVDAQRRFLARLENDRVARC